MIADQRSAGSKFLITRSGKALFRLLVPPACKCHLVALCSCLKEIILIPLPSWSQISSWTAMPHSRSCARRRVLPATTRVKVTPAMTDFRAQWWRLSQDIQQEIQQCWQFKNIVTSRTEQERTWQAAHKQSSCA
mmetsp:Transcript_152492/g.264994  ORF Transcript_152492/g.264994 Transcript_152492/m.264994 type:complete len:134 (+) Transcript_152492:27-428(+)